MNQVNKYRKKPVIIEGVQWFKDGDHSEVESYLEAFSTNGKSKCLMCGQRMMAHGWIDTLEGGI